MSSNGKISETQRKYFASRINDEFNEEIRLLKQQEAKDISETTETNMSEYLDTIGLTKLVDNYRKKEKAFMNIKTKMSNIINNLEESDPTPSAIKSKNNFYGTCNVYEYKDVKRYFNMKCNQVARSYYKKQNKAVSILENKRKEAIDHVYGMTKNNEIVVGLKKIFKGTNVKFLIGGPK